MLILSQENYIKKTLILLKMNETMSASILRIFSKYYKINEKEIFIEESYKYFQLINNIMYKILVAG